jgi:hypothetical protein
VDEHKALAKEMLLEMLSTAPGGIGFVGIVDAMLQTFMLRETNVRDMCVELAKTGKVEKTWGTGGRKPSDHTVVKLASM